MGEAKRRKRIEVELRQVALDAIPEGRVDAELAQEGLKRLSVILKSGMQVRPGTQDILSVTCPACGLTIVATQKQGGSFGFSYPDESPCPYPNPKGTPEALHCPAMKVVYLDAIERFQASFADDPRGLVSGTVGRSVP